MSRVLTPMLVAAISLLPVQISLCQAAAAPESAPVELPAEKNKVAVEKTPDNATVLPKVTTYDSSLSTGAWVGIGAGAVVLLGGAVALGSGGGGGGDIYTGPPTEAMMVGTYSARGEHPSTGRSYVGTYQLFEGGGIGYDIRVTDGRHLIGGGSFKIDGYRIKIHTDHGSTYSGDLTPGVYNTIALHSNTAWRLTLTR